MKTTRAASKVLALIACAALGCEDQQYVSPDTVALVITSDASNTQLVNRCNYVPVLLGSRIGARYRVEDQLFANIDLTREAVTVFFETDGEAVEPFSLDSKRFNDQAREVDPAPPGGYSVELSSPCMPEDP
jgi:hypothetical protein